MTALSAVLQQPKNDKCSVYLVLWQAGDLPLSDLNGFTQSGSQRKVIGAFYGELKFVKKPYLWYVRILISILSRQLIKHFLLFLVFLRIPGKHGH